MVGMQKRSSKFMKIYTLVKAIQIVLVLITSYLVLTNIIAIANEMADEEIERESEDARRHGEAPPKIDREALVIICRLYLMATTRMALIFWCTLGTYSLYVIQSLSTWYARGSDPAEPRVIVTVPPYAQDAPMTELQSGSRIQYATPLLQGQSPAIPIAVR